ncbi:MAG: HNH endonuclease [Cyclobacteriaceae bacterium]|nr:HNH endonuclease [Cyclobacteriaceae bacterium]
MAKDLHNLRRIYDRTDGRCHLCHCKLSFKNHGMRGMRGAWHIEHSKARANGGTDHGNNVLPACIDCNLNKSILKSRIVRKQYGTTRAPYSKSRKEKIRENNTTAGAVIGGIIGAVGGPVGFFVCATIGAIIGNETSPRV